MQQGTAPLRVTVTFPDGTVTLLPRRAPVGNSGPIRGETLLALPLLIGESLSAAAGRLTAFLQRPLQHAPATLSHTGQAEQPAIAVLGLTATEAALVGRISDLESVFFWDGRRAGILACSPDS